MCIIQDELNKLNMVCHNFSILQAKDGIVVARVVSDGGCYVLKCFQKDEDKRELGNYRLLSSLGIPTIRVISSTESALLLEDIGNSMTYRLGIKEDMSDPEVARRIAVWYKALHSKGYDYVFRYGESMYDEADFFTLDNIGFIKKMTGTQDEPAWSVLERNYMPIRDLLLKASRTLTYNDFYYTNLVVEKDKSSALMFDYNLLGKGYAYTDVRNVLSSLSEDAGKAFLDEYGEIDPVEKALDDVVSVVVSLYLACRRDVFPWWAQALVDEIGATFAEKVACLCELL